MAILIMKDGTEKTVTYKAAATIYQILLGNDQPKTEEQTNFCKLVDRVEFDTIPGISPHYGNGNLTQRWKQYQQKKRQQELLQ